MDCLPQIHIAALHAEGDFRTFTPGVGVLCRKSNQIHGAAVLQNSIGKTSRLAFTGYQPREFGVIAGVIDGYTQNKVYPFVALVFSHKNFHVTVLPPVPNLTPVTVQFSMTLGK